MDEKKEKSLPWVEKYRPQKLDDVAHQDEVVMTLKRTLETANLPHLLFYGPPGTGKTSTILAVSKQLYGPIWKDRVLELNASHERGIDAIRKRVKDFAQIAVGSQSVAGFPCPPYKIIILDEADSMTRDAQSALRRIMENYTKVTRFCIICNYVSRIIEPIASRCAKFRFKPLSEESMMKRLQFIADKEKIAPTKEAYSALIRVSEGDMRRSINIMQTAQKLLSGEKELSEDSVLEVAGVIPVQVIEKVVAACIANSFSELQATAREVVDAGYPIDQLLFQLQPEIVQDAKLSDTHKAKIAIKIAEADKKLIDGADEYLQLLDVLSFISTTILKVE